MAHPTAVAIRLAKAIEGINARLARIEVALGIGGETSVDGSSAPASSSSLSPAPLPAPKHLAQSLTKQRG